MSKELKVGDRVAVYESRTRETGRVKEIRESGAVVVQLDREAVVGGETLWVHPKQCRRLVKKRRMEFWIRVAETWKPEEGYWLMAYGSEHALEHHKTIECGPHRTVRVREVKA